MLLGGFFAVPHSKGRQRLILDRRPLNACEVEKSFCNFTCIRSTAAVIICFLTFSPVVDTVKLEFKIIFGLYLFES